MKKFIINFWTGSGYLTAPLQVTAENEEEALLKGVAFITTNLYWGKPFYLDVDEVENYDEEYFLFIDAIEYGATKPVFIWAENLHIEEGCFDPKAEFAFYDYGKIKKFNTNNI